MEEGTATLYSMYDFAGSDFPENLGGRSYPTNLIIHYTIIKQDGTVKTPNQIDSIMDRLLSNKKPSTILSTDTDHLVLWIQDAGNDWSVAKDKADKFDEILHVLQAYYYLNDSSELPETEKEKSDFIEDLRSFSDDYLTIAEMNWDIFNPGNDEYILENQEAINQRTMSDRGNGTISSRAGRISSGLDGNSKEFNKQYKYFRVTAEDDIQFHADSILEQSERHRIVASTLAVISGDILFDSTNEGALQTITVDGENVLVKPMWGTHYHQTSTGSTSVVQDVTGVRVKPVVDPDTGITTYEPVYATDSFGQPIIDLVTGEKVWATAEEAEENEVNIPSRSISRQTQEEFYQVIGTTNIKTILNPDNPDAQSAPNFSALVEYHIGDYVYHKDDDGVKRLYLFTSNHPKGPWDPSHVSLSKMMTIETITGSTMWQNEENIVNVVGTVEVVSTIPGGAQGAGTFSKTTRYHAGEYVWYPMKEGNNTHLYQFLVDHQGEWNPEHVNMIQTKMVQVKEGAGLSVYQNGSALGIYSNGQLDAGLIAESLNDNSNSMLATEFSENRAYSSGDYVRYEGKVYRFTANHSEGPWIGTDAEAVSGTIVKLKADCIDLGEYATVDSLKARIARIDSLFAGDATIRYNIYAGSAQASSVVATESTTATLSAATDT